MLKKRGIKADERRGGRTRKERRELGKEKEKEENRSLEVNLRTEIPINQKGLIDESREKTAQLVRRTQQTMLRVG